MNARSDFLKREAQGVGTLHIVSFTTMERKVRERMERGEGCWIDVLEVSWGEEPLYRACGQNGAICRYTNDLWQAEIYVQYY
jgi:hypothetical protein